MREGIDFYYDGIRSSDMGLIHVNVGSSGMLEEPFLSTREIYEVKTKGNPQPYLFLVEKNPLSFTVSFAFENRYDEQLIRKVARWLDADYYKPFYTTDNPDRWWYCMPSEDSFLIHNGLKEGYLSLTMRCDSPYSYSRIYTLPVLDLSANTSEGYLFSFESLGDLPLKPELWIHMVEDGDVKIVNEITGDCFQFENLLHDETVYVNNEREYIESNINAMYRYDNFNNQYLILPRGKHHLRIFGKCKLQWRYQFKTLQG